MCTFDALYSKMRLDKNAAKKKERRDFCGRSLHLIFFPCGGERNAIQSHLLSKEWGLMMSESLINMPRLSLSPPEPSL
jgi:hypothetical protein